MRSGWLTHYCHRWRLGFGLKASLSGLGLVKGEKRNLPEVGQQVQPVPPLHLGLSTI